MAPHRSLAFCVALAAAGVPLLCAIAPAQTSTDAPTNAPTKAPKSAPATAPAPSPADKSGQAASLFDPARHMHTSEVKPGMTGYGLSVFKGTKIEKFDVVVLSVLHNQMGPGQNVVLIRCAGQGLEHSGSIEGMSGSPIYLKDDAGKYRMIGAFALGWNFTTDPIAGVRPIEEMLRVPTDKPEPATRPTGAGRAGAGQAGAGRATGGADADASLATAVPSGRRSWSLQDTSVMRAALRRRTAAGAARGATGGNFIGESVSNGELGRENGESGSELGSARIVRGDGVASLDGPPLDPLGPLDALAAGHTAMRPLSTPLMLARATPQTLAALSDTFAGTQFKLMQSGSAGDAPEGTQIPKLEPGAAIGIPIVSGDLDAAAIGTVTEVIGNRVYAFGHEFNAEGNVQLPMGVGYIHGIIPNLNSSFKLGSLLHLDGAIYADETTGIAGLIGEVPKTIPVELKVITPNQLAGRTFKYNLVQHPMFTPQIAPTLLSQALTASRALPTEYTMSYTLKLTFDNGKTITIDNIATSNTWGGTYLQQVSLPIAAAMENPFRRVKLTGMTGEMTVTANAKSEQLLTCSPAKPTYKPGETVKLNVTTRRFRGDESTRVVELPLPRDLKEGTYSLCVSDSDTFQTQEGYTSPYRQKMDDIDSVFAVVQDYLKPRADVMYLRLISQKAGVSVGRIGLGSMPQSQLLLLGSTGRTDIGGFVSSIVKKIPLDCCLSGSAVVQIVVSKNPNKPLGGQGGPVNGPGNGQGNAQQTPTLEMQVQE